MIKGIQDLDKEWPLIKDKIERALQYSNGAYSINDVYDNMLNKINQLWVYNDLAWVSRIDTYPQKKICTILYIGGSNLEDIKYIAPFMCQWAKTEGCDYLEIRGRKGWAKIFDGTINETITLGKEL